MIGTVKRFVSTCLCLLTTLSMDCAQKPSPLSIDWGLIAIAASIVKIPRFVFVTSNTGNVYVYSINPFVCSLNPLSPMWAPASPGIPAIDSTGQFLFVPGSVANQIASYRINTTTGVLTQVGFVSTTSPTALAYDPAVGQVLSVSTGSSMISRFALMPDGSLTSAGSVAMPAPASGNIAIDTGSRIAFVPHGISLFSAASLAAGVASSSSAPAVATSAALNGGYLYVGGSTTILTYRLNGTNAPGFVSTTPSAGTLTSLAADSQGANLYGADATGVLNRYAIQNGGTLLLNSQSLFGPSANSIAVDPTGTCVVMSGGSNVRAFRTSSAGLTLFAAGFVSNPNAVLIASY